ncbi:hypothetical protein B0T21DRAFT_455792 [Apiosordaria backusii]|uniref:Cellobiose dehydrogenase-like cytochrome domain-containing protein n=1 Tax=Apiosordaria backusii TaxID=314023 RepID=A0AA39ZQ52_9PEZI|nr:hypothetical protein B0T21DRAFT_455792 [Apiosordaria backusii]
MLNSSKLTAAAIFLGLAARTAQQELKGTLNTDPLTNVTFLNFYPSTSPNFRLSFALPIETTPSSKDLLIQIITPLNPNHSGWGGIALSSSGMRGGLLVAAWYVPPPPRPARKRNLHLHPPPTHHLLRLSHPHLQRLRHRPAISPIPSGTYLNKTHLVSTFLCGGCVKNPDGFQISPDNQKARLAYAFSAIDVPADNYDREAQQVKMSDHTGGGELGGEGWFEIVVDEARSDIFGEWAKMAGRGGESEGTGPGPTDDGGLVTSSVSVAAATSAVTASATSTTETGEPIESGGGVGDDGESRGGDARYDGLSPLAVVVMGLVGGMYLVQPFVWT